MNYCTYFKQTGIIQSVTSTLPTSDLLSYIELSPEETEMFCSGSKSLSHFIVVPDYPGSITGKLVDPRDLERTWTSIDDIIFAIPKKVNDAVFNIVQDQLNKTCTAKLSQKQIMNRNIEHLVLAACVPGDPHLPLWIWTVNYSDLLDNDVKINYIGTDNIEFYTRRNFDTYSHEQI
jgi:hypothetical protein